MSLDTIGLSPLEFAPDTLAYRVDFANGCPDTVTVAWFERSPAWEGYWSPREEVTLAPGAAIARVVKWPKDYGGGWSIPTPLLCWCARVGEWDGWDGDYFSHRKYPEAWSWEQVGEG